MKFKNDPFEIIFDVFSALFPGLDCTVEWCTGMKDEDGYTVCGATVFPADGGKPIVSVSGEIAIENAVEVLAHELAHVAAGEAAQHDEVWERAFEAIHEEYMRRIGAYEDRPAR